MPANPFLSLNDSTSGSSNPFLALNQTPQTQANKPTIAPALAGAGQQLANIGHQIANPVATGLDALGLTQNSKQNVDNFFSKHVDNFYRPIMAENPNAALGGQIGGAIIGSAPTMLNAAGLAAKAGLGAVNGYINSDPNASMFEKGINTVGGAGLNMIPGGAATATALGAAGGYGYGAATGGDAGKDALIGGGLGLSTYAGGKGLINTLRGANAALVGPTELANIATHKTLEATGKGLSQTTPEQYFQQVDNLTNAAKIAKNNDYNALYKQADQEGVKVTKTNLAQLTDSLQQQVDKGATSETAATLREAKRLLGKPEVTVTPAGKIVDDSGDLLNPGSTEVKPTTSSYKDAYGLVSDIGKKINTANRQGDFALAQKLSPLKDALLADIKAGGGSDALQTMKTNTDNFYKNVYAPLRSMDARGALADNWATGKALDTILNQSVRTPDAINAFRAANQAGRPELQNNLEQKLVAAHVSATKNAAILDGTINPKKYGDALAKNLKDYPEAFGTATSHLQALGDALDVAQQAAKIRSMGTEHSLGQKIGMGLGTSLASSTIGGGATYYGTGDPLEAAKVAAGAFFIPKALYMYGAGKMLQNPTTRALLSRAATLSDQAPSETKAAISNMIAKKFQHHIQSIPPKLLPVFTNSSSPQQQQ